MKAQACRAYRCATEFQSPCGEVVMKAVSTIVVVTSGDGVSVPLRGSGDESLLPLLLLLLLLLLFQSPCGEVVMKAVCSLLLLLLVLLAVSVPLRGSGDERILRPTPPKR